MISIDRCSSLVKTLAWVAIDQYKSLHNISRRKGTASFTIDYNCCKFHNYIRKLGYCMCTAHQLKNSWSGPLYYHIHRHHIALQSMSIISYPLLSFTYEYYVEVILCFDVLIGVGKTSLAHLILKGTSIARPPQTIGCSVGVKVKTPHILVIQENV